MVDMGGLITSSANTLTDLSKQASVLGNSLQNAAPGNKAGLPNNSVQYLLDISESLAEISKQCDEIR